MGAWDSRFVAFANETSGPMCGGWYRTPGGRAARRASGASCDSPQRFLRPEMRIAPRTRETFLAALGNRTPRCCRRSPDPVHVSRRTGSGRWSRTWSGQGAIPNQRSDLAGDPETGPEALGIVALINFLIRLILASSEPPPSHSSGQTSTSRTWSPLRTTREMACIMTAHHPVRPHRCFLRRLTWEP